MRKLFTRKKSVYKFEYSVLLSSFALVNDYIGKVIKYVNKKMANHRLIADKYTLR